MATAEEREAAEGGEGREGREGREGLRERVVEAARDIVSEEGLDALSMRALALRTGVSPGSIYLQFEDKDEILRGVMEEGFKRLGETMERELASLPAGSTPLEQYAATGRGYARFAVENTGYFRAMFKMPRVANLEMCPDPGPDLPSSGQEAKDFGVGLVRRAVAAGQMNTRDPERAALVGWGVMHGLTSLYLSGHLSEHAQTNEEFMDLIESAIEALRTGWQPRTEAK